MTTVIAVVAFLAGAAVALLIGGYAAHLARRREETAVKLLSALYVGLNEAAAGGAWPIEMGPLPESQGGSGELVLWDLFAQEPKAVTSTPGATVDAHAALLRNALTKGDEEFHFERRKVDTGRLAYGLAGLIRQQGEPALGITFFRVRRFTGRELNWASAFGRLMGDALEIVLSQRRNALVAELIDRIDKAEDTMGVIAVVTEMLSRELGGMLTTLLRYERGVFRPYALVGNMSEGVRAFIMQGYAAGTGLAWHVYREGEALYLDRYAEHPSAAQELKDLGIGPVAMVPLDPGAGSRSILAVASEGRRHWRPHDRELIERFRQILRVVLELRYTEERLDAVVQLERELVVTDTNAMPGRLVESAVTMVPGSESGSLLVRDGNGYRFTAVYGYNPHDVVDAFFSHEDALRWYGAEPARFYRGEPRLAVAAGGETLFTQLPDHQVAELAGEVGSPLANLCLPVVDHGEVVALLNLDALHDRNAFGPEALEVARAFQPLIAFVLRDAEMRQRLTETATTDALTGLANRRAFDEEAERAFAAAERYGTSLALLVMDMRGFKAINDSFGHVAGDEVLRRVAAALATVPRAGDIVFRWGGDEFAALLRNVDSAEALRVAERFAEEVAAVEVIDQELAINVGVAIYPEDAGSIEELLKVADERMYRAKEAGVTMIGTGAAPLSEREPEAPGDLGT